MNDLIEKIALGLGAVVMASVILFVVLFITSIVTQWAWNTLMPYAFKLPEINFWQAFAFNLLASQFRSTLTQKK